MADHKYFRLAMQSIFYKIKHLAGILKNYIIKPGMVNIITVNSMDQETKLYMIMKTALYFLIDNCLNIYE